MVSTCTHDTAGLRRRILKHIRKVRSGCWLWTGACSYGRYPHDTPYGYLRVDRKHIQVRRLVYVLFGNQPPLRQYRVESTCGNSLCVNPDHLVRSATGKSRGRPARPRNYQRCLWEEK